MISTRTWVWGSLLLLCVAAVALAPPGDGGKPQAAAVPATIRPALAMSGLAVGSEAVRVLRIEVRRPEPEDDAETGSLWLSARPPGPAAEAAPTGITQAPPPPARAEPPTVPAPPYRLLGRYSQEGRPGVILQALEGEVVIVHDGEMLGEQYRVDSITGNVMMLTYLPLKAAQVMDIGMPQ